MTEYVNKAQFRRQLIDRQITTQFFNPRERHEIGCVIEMLDNTPTADVVEVVRCKDCKHYMSDICYHDFGLNFLRGDDFCSYAERRES